MHKFTIPKWKSLEHRFYYAAENEASDQVNQVGLLDCCNYVPQLSFIVNFNTLRCRNSTGKRTEFCNKSALCISSYTQ